ncbi:MAG TPA: DUF1684 domain-containing protein [Thermoanaerobaculia bacterium]|nr:DUF1684 domain-containing protein [Thermoanaerobaculia bacterium]
MRTSALASSPRRRGATAGWIALLGVVPAAAFAAASAPAGSGAPAGSAPSSVTVVHFAPAEPTAPTASVAPDEALHRKEIEGWRAERLAGLKKDNGWFTLVGLFWLHEGENRFGSDPGNVVILPQGKAPAVAGVLVRHGNDVELRAEPGAGVQHDGKQVATLALASDAKGPTTVLKLGSLSFYLIKRGDRLGVRVKDSQSPALAAFHGIESFPIDGRWRVVARFEPHQPPKKIPIANVLGTTEDQPSPGVVVFEHEGKTYRLDALTESDDGSLFLIFADQTNGRESYGAGRFLNTPAPKDGKVVVDFNKAYNPPCAFSAFATCPLPPPQNRLALRIEAGEKKYGDGHH